ncbi:MAG TPA: hypothetical protein ENO12_01755 [Thermoplasmatales archaeon]|nr:hypothetical protein [Thermoplasmatales archaeon]
MKQGKNMLLSVSIDFCDLIAAFEQSTGSTHFFIDIKGNTIISIDASKDADAQAKLRQMEKNTNYLKVPSWESTDDELFRETFMYESDDSALEDIFYETLDRENGFQQFLHLLESHPQVKKQWVEYRAAAMRNRLINWLCDTNIELPNQHLIPEIEIHELTTEEIDQLPDEIKDFKPYACLHCHNKTRMNARIFSINVSPENRLIEQETQRIMKEQFGISHHGGWSGGDQEFLTASQCPRCGCEEIFWDY